ncbi:MAG: hypothetical protein IPJ76_04585 [Flavobacteriales bacterium]|nr:MAG: hypothetical protein IPJ76_04585 [Flavobacteriales bacterium]
MKAYRDSLKEVQIAWSFNTLASLVKMKSYTVELGDTCMMDVFLAAGNSEHSSFRHRDPVLNVAGTGDGAGAPTIIKGKDIGWRVWFVPTKVGKDSVVGSILVPDQRGYADTTELMFSVYYDVGSE